MMMHISQRKKKKKKVDEGETSKRYLPKSRDREKGTKEVHIMCLGEGGGRPVPSGVGRGWGKRLTVVGFSVEEQVVAGLFVPVWREKALGMICQKGGGEGKKSGDTLPSVGSKGKELKGATSTVKGSTGPEGK